MRIREITPIVVLLAALASPERANAQTDTAALQRILTAEDARGKGAAGTAPLLEGIHSGDSLTRRVAVRAMGRLQKPELSTLIVPVLTDAAPAVRSEAANAIAQSLWRARRGITATDSSQLLVRAAARPLMDALAAEQGDAVAADMAESLGRLRFGDSAQAREAEHAILAKAAGHASFGTATGLYWLALARRVTGALTPAAVTLLNDAARTSTDTLTRRAAMLALSATGGLDSGTVRAAFGDADAQVRRRALFGITTLGPDDRAELIRRAIADKSAIVRATAPAAARAGVPSPDCAPLIPLLRDPNAWVAIAVTDSLGSACADRAAVTQALAAIIEHPPAEVVPDHRWQRAAHALVALAKADSARARALIPRFASSTRWQERVYAATAAGSAADTPLLLRLTHDRDHNVVEAAINGLAATAKHDADSAYVAALASSGNQVVLAAAQALAGTHDSTALPAIFHALDSISNTRRENARDPRMELLKRVNELGTPASIARLSPYLADFDTSIAAGAATILSRWSNITVTPNAQPLPIPPAPLAGVLLARDIRVRFTMAASSGGGTFTVRMFGDDATATVAHILSMIRRHYYDGHRFQRVEPDFVVQGGGGDATEYVGDDTFFRDELSRRSSFHGIAGMSARGRDTGDGQWYFNLVDNTRLDHEYTNFGEIIQGMSVVERILEDDVIARVEIVR